MRLILAMLLSALILLPAGPARARTVVTVMLLGDSIFKGVTVAVADGSEVGPRLVLTQQLAAAGFSVDLVGSLATGAFDDNQHEGHAGFRIEQLEAHIDNWLTDHPADVVIVMAGTNDAAQGLPGGAWRMAALVDRIAKHSPYTVILVSSIPPINPSGGGGTIASADLAARHNAELPAAIANRQTAGRKVTLINAGGSLSVTDLDSGGIHPNTTGYTRLGTAIYDALSLALPPSLARRSVKSFTPGGQP